MKMYTLSAFAMALLTASAVKVDALTGTEVTGIDTAGTVATDEPKTPDDYPDCYYPEDQWPFIWCLYDYYDQMGDADQFGNVAHITETLKDLGCPAPDKLEEVSEKFT